MEYISQTYNPSTNQRKKLRKLANYLLSLPEDYDKFDMTHFFYTDYVHLNLNEVGKKTLHTCGTAACALGHAASIFRVPKECWWGDLAKSLFGIDGVSEEWDWCFSGDWADVDNTHYGAAKRILWLLDKGLPDQWSYQLQGEDDLCYK